MTTKPTPSTLAATVTSSMGTIAGFTRPSVKRFNSRREAVEFARANWQPASYPNAAGTSYLYVAAYSGPGRVEAAPVTAHWDRDTGDLNFYWV